MKRKIISLIMISVILPFSFFSYGFSVYKISVIDGSNKIVKSFLSSPNITSPLQRALDYTENNAYEDNILTIRLTEGEYYVRDTIHVSSYTVIDLNNSLICNSNPSRGNIFKSPEDIEYPKYSSLIDFTIKNGALDNKFNINKSCIVRLCHCENIRIINVSFLNNYFSHHIELAAAKNVVFDNCRFIGQISNLKISSSEAIQLDILDKVHFYGFTCYDNTMNDNILIKKCLFKNVYRGVGTHNYFKGLYQTNIEISECTFQNLNDCAISAVNFKNINVYNNNYINCKYSVFSRDNGK